MKLKRILSAALATVMAASVMSVGMITTASAAEPGDVYAVFQSTTDKTANADQNFLDASDIISVDGPTGDNDLGATLTETLEGGKTLTASRRSGTGAFQVVVKVPEGVTDATLYFVARSSGSAARTFTIAPPTNNTNGDATEATDNKKGYLIKFHGLTGGTTYTVTPSDNWAYSCAVLEINTASNVYYADSFSPETEAIIESEPTEVDSMVADKTFYDAAIAAGEAGRDDSHPGDITIGGAEGSTVNVSKGGKITFDNSSATHLLCIEHQTEADTYRFKTIGTSRKITVNLAENEFVRIEGFISVNDSTDRGIKFEGKDYLAKAYTEPAETLDLVPSAPGSYDITSVTNGIAFTAIRIMHKDVTPDESVPTITLSDPVVEGSDVAFTATIKGDVTPDATVDSINFKYAIGSTDKAQINAANDVDKENGGINKVYGDGTNFLFKVVVGGAAAPGAVPGIKAQASLKYDKGDVYSNVAEYKPAQ